MKLYKLPFVLHSPREETEDKYLAEIPALPGCRAWGDTPGQALEYLQSVATAFIESYREHGDPLPEAVGKIAVEVATDEALGEVITRVKRPWTDGLSQINLTLGRRKRPPIPSLPHSLRSRLRLTLGQALAFPRKGGSPDKSGFPPP